MKYGFLLVLLLLPFALDARAAGEVRLTGVTTSESPGQNRLVLDFTSLPAYRVEKSGQRVDLILPETSISSAWRGQPEGGRVIKILYARKKDELIVSFLLRQSPARILTSTEGPRRLILDLFWREPPTRSGIAFLVPGMPVVGMGGTSATVKPGSKYAGNWEKFFREYRTPLVLDVPLRYSLPSLPAETAESPEAAVYLESHALARAGDPHGAKIVLRKVLDAAEVRHPLLPYCRLLQAELALATEAFDEAATLLEKRGKDWPAAVEAPRRARLATALARAGRPDQSFKAFGARENLLDLLSGLPFSLGSAAALYSAREENAVAADLYGALSLELGDPARQALTRFAWALAAAQGKGNDLALEELKRLKAATPSTEAGQRARLKLLDLDVLAGGEPEYPAALAGYGALAGESVLKGLREEAAFKQVLILMWSGQRERSVYHLQEFLRGFRESVLRSEAEALLMELLPPVIQELIARGEDLQAVVLVEQNRQLLMNGGLDRGFLLGLTRAFNRLGLPERAVRIYLFMLEGSRRDADNEALYLPLVQLFGEREDYRQADRYAGEYLERYPQGEDRGRIFLWRLRALRESGELAEAAGLLKSTKVPWDRELEFETARILTAAGDYRLLCEIAGSRQGEWEPDPQALLLHAEALRETGRPSRALPIFHGLMSEEAVADQASFRCAQIRLEQGEEKEALKILSRLVETGKSPLWRKLAEETLRTATI